MNSHQELQVDGQPTMNSCNQLYSEGDVEEDIGV